MSSNDVSSTLCRLPWTHLQIEQDGSFRPCCRTLGFRQNRNFDRKAYEDSEELISLKKALLNGESPKDCQRCWSDEKHGSYSFRQIENKKYDSLLNELQVERKPVQKLKTMEVRLGNLCNLSCRMCSTAYSSKWISEIRSATEDQAASESFQRSVGSVNQVYQMDQKNLSQYAEWASDCDEIYLSGGEPFSFPQLPKFISELKEKTKGQASLSISTNGTFYDPIAFQSLSEFKKVDISVSIDAIGLANDYIRTGSRWSQIEKNLKKFKSHFPRIHFVLAPTINIYNIYYLPELLEYFDQELKPEFTLKQKFNFQVYPEWQSLEAIPSQMKKAILEKFQLSSVSGETKDLLAAVATRLSQTEYRPQATKNFLRLNAIYDQIKNQKLQDYLPELNHLLEDDFGSDVRTEV